MSQQQIRQRIVTSSGNNTMGTDNNREDDDLIMRSGAGLSPSSMLRASPIEHGATMKLHIPLLYSLCPSFIQRFLSSWSIFSMLGLVPQWKQRYLILIGSFLYKFNSQHSSTPKGTPFPVESIDVRLVQRNGQGRHTIDNETIEDADIELHHLPPGYNAVFVVSTLRKKHYYAVSSVEVCSTWVSSLREARQEQISKSLGHTNNKPYPKAWEYFDTLGRSLCKSNERIKAKIEEVNLREMEMSGLGDGPISRGYYG